MLHDLIKQLNNPTSEYRGAPFWSWNGKLDPEELRKQIRVMGDMALFSISSCICLIRPERLVYPLPNPLEMMPFQA